MAKIPNTNNKGDVKQKRTAEDVISNPGTYAFNGSIVKRMYPNEKLWVRFVNRYFSARMGPLFRTSNYAPKAYELKLFNEYKAGKLDLKELSKRLKLPSITHAAQKIGRMEIYAIEKSKQ